MLMQLINLGQDSIATPLQQLLRFAKCDISPVKRSLRMRLLVLIVTTLAFMPKAIADEKIKADLTTNAEYRVRYLYEKNAAGGASSLPNTLNSFHHRFKLGFNFRASEKISATATLIHTALWGSDQNTLDSANGTPDANGTDNFLMVNEAYGRWMVADDLHLKIGRQNFELGDGNVIGVNDWHEIPYAFDGVSALYEIEVGAFQLWGFKIAELTKGPSDPAAATDLYGGDPEHNSFGVSFDLKAKPELVKMAHIHVIKDLRATAPDPTLTSANSEYGMDLFRIGAALKIEVSGFDLHANYSSRSGDYKFQENPGDAVSKLDGSANMMQIQTGYTFEEWMRTRIGFVYHADSGTKSGSTDKMNTYDGYFYEDHRNAGLMDLLNWGNLTYWGASIDANPSDATKVGLAYLKFSKTEDGSDVVAGPNGRYLFYTSSTVLANSTAHNDIGGEIDLYAEHSYDSGLNMITRFGYFMPGGALDNSTIQRGEGVWQAMVQGKMTF